jgi:hypothetical protein
MCLGEQSNFVGKIRPFTQVCLCEFSGSHGVDYEDDRQPSGTLRRVVS